MIPHICPVFGLVFVSVCDRLFRTRLLFISEEKAGTSVTVLCAQTWRPALKPVTYSRPARPWTTRQCGRTVEEKELSSTLCNLWEGFCPPGPGNLPGSAKGRSAKSKNTPAYKPWLWILKAVRVPSLARILSWCHKRAVVIAGEAVCVCINSAPASLYGRSEANTQLGRSRMKQSKLDSLD